MQKERWFTSSVRRRTERQVLLLTLLTDYCRGPVLRKRSSGGGVVCPRTMLERYLLGVIDGDMLEREEKEGREKRASMYCDELLTNKLYQCLRDTLKPCLDLLLIPTHYQWCYQSIKRFHCNASGSVFINN